MGDLSRLPFTTKQDLRDNYPFNMFAVPMDNVVRIHASSGTTGQPTVVGYTARDVSTWSRLMARSLTAGGAGQGDIIHNAYGYVFEDHFIPEIVDPKTLEPQPYGTAGELVFTSLTKEAFPVIRYRTRDITSLNPEPCICGRTHVRMNRVTGRSDDMLIIRGVNVFPSQIESVLMEIEDVEPHYQLVVDREDNLDVLTVNVEVGERGFSDEVKGLQLLERRITKNIKELLGVSARVKLVEPKAIERSQGKAVRVLDNRKI